MALSKDDVGIRILKGNSTFFIRVANERLARDLAQTLIHVANERLMVQVVCGLQITDTFDSLVDEQ